jgi:hypothetical protein
MHTTIDLPESTYRKGEQAALAQGVTVEDFILRAFERELEADALPACSSKRVVLPLLSSKEPRTMDLRGFNFDDLLAGGQSRDSASDPDIPTVRRTG